MPIKNYTTGINVSKTLGEISEMLVKAKACAVLTEYDAGIPCAVSFKINTQYGLTAFRLPGNIQQIYQVLVRDQRIPRSARTQEQAARVAWRIIRDWLDAQLAIIEAGLVDVHQVFLPYIQANDGRTLYELLRDREFNLQPLLKDRA